MAKYEIKDGVGIIPEGTTEIAECAFKSSGLTSISIPDSVKEIKERAFAFCAQLTNVVVPHSVTKIDNLTFLKCTTTTHQPPPDFKKREIGGLG